MNTDRPISVFIFGNPNVGKSALFNWLTGAEQTTGNWCGKTTEPCTMTVKYAGRSVTFTDFPGIYGFGQHSREQAIINDAVIKGKPDVILVMVDALNLERNLFIALQALERFERVAIVLSKMDLAAKQGINIDTSKLGSILRVPVLTVAKEIDADEFYATIFRLAETAPSQPIQVNYPPAVEEAIAVEEAVLPEDNPRRRGEAIKRLEEDQQWQVPIINARYALAKEIVNQCCQQTDNTVSLSERIDYWVLHKYWGLPLLVAVFALLFYFTFAVSAPFSEYIVTGFDWLSQQVPAYFERWALPPTITSLVADGLLKGVGAAAGFLPQMAVFFLVYTLLQDSGYLVRVSFLMDRVMRALGLNGKAFLPLVIGCTCNVNSILATRMLTSSFDRIVAILVSSFIPCSARIGVMIFLVSAFFSSGQAVLVMLGLITCCLVLMTVVAYAVKWLSRSDEQTGFLMEMPPYQFPDLRTLLRVTWRLTGFFVRRIRNVIVAASVVIWFLSSYPPGPFENSYIAAVGKVLEPFGQLMGLNWQLIVALILGIAAKETALSALGIMYHAAEDTGTLSQVLAADIDPLAAFTFIFVYMIYTPCLTTILTIYHETKSWRFTAVCILTNFVLALAVGMTIYNIGRLWLV